MTVVIGLTGNIASGKSHIASIFRELGAVVYNSDIAAHEVMENEAFAPVAREFPAAVENGKINRQLLGREVFGDEGKLKKLEAILHPLVRQKNVEFIAAHSGKVIILEIPLLFETQAEVICDHVVFVHVSRETQAKRALQRAGMTKEKLANIIAKQEKIPVEEKLARADFVIENDKDHDVAAQVKAILAKLA